MKFANQSICGLMMFMFPKERCIGLVVGMSIILAEVDVVGYLLMSC